MQKVALPTQYTDLNIGLDESLIIMWQVALSYQYTDLRQNKSEYYVRKELEKYVPGCICIFWDIDLIKNPAYVWEGVEYYFAILIWWYNNQAYVLKEVENNMKCCFS